MVRKTIVVFVAFVVAYIILAGIVLGLLYNSNASTIVSALASVALVFVTLGLVIATYSYTEAANSQAEAMNRQVAALTDPIIIFSVEEVLMTSQFFVQNVGPGTAYDVNFVVLDDFEFPVLADDQKLAELAFLKKTLKTLAPGQKLPFAVVDPRHNNILSKETVEVEVSYKNKLDATESFERRFPIDFAYVEGMREVRETPPYQLQKIAKSIASIETKFK